MVTGKSRSPQSRRGGVEWAQRATARDVAALSGVSAQTVSRVANGAQNVKPETKQRVLDAMEKIGYRPNAAARSLRSGRSDVIGLVAHHMARTGEAHTAEAIATAAHASGYAVSLAHSRSGGVEDLNTALNQLRQDVAGLVVLGMEAEQIEQLVVPPHTPVVIADSRALSHPTLGIDQVGGAVLAVEHLLGLGHATVHFVSGPQDSVQSQLRESGWRQALLRRGRPCLHRILETGRRPPATELAPRWPRTRRPLRCSAPTTRWPRVCCALCMSGVVRCRTRFQWSGSTTSWPNTYGRR